MRIQPVTLPEISGVDPGERVQAMVAVAAAVKTLRVQAEMAKAVVALLDPNLGRNLDRAA